MMQTPYFLIKEDRLNENVTSFSRALAEYWSNSFIAYSIKTNSLPWLLNYMKRMGLRVEAVSDEEYELARLAGFAPDEIVFNGPIKGRELLRFAYEHGSYINMDSVSDVECLSELPLERTDRLGIRINVPSEIFESEDVGYTEDGFRFGFSEANGAFARVIEQMGLKGKRFGLHLHCNSITRNVTVYRAIAKYAKGLIEAYHLTPSFIDMGGGFAGGIPGKPTAAEYIVAIKQELSGTVDFNQTTLIVEPGSAIIGSVVELHTSVLDVKDTASSRIVTTDGSRIYLDPLWKKKGYKLEIHQKEPSNAILEKQILCGYTCMDHDRIMVLEDREELRRGDEIVYMREGAYSMTLGGIFIRFLCDVYVEENGSLTQVRRKMTAEEYYRLQSL